MNCEEWIDSDSACALLGVRHQTLYAYVSRGLLRASSDAADSRRSLYALTDVKALLARNSRPRARAEVAAQAIRWGEPVLETSISGVQEGVLMFGDRSAISCANNMTLEEVAAHHWQTEAILASDRADPLPTAGDGTQRMMEVLTAAIANAAPLRGRMRESIAAEAGGLMSACVDGLLGARLEGPVHMRLAQSYGLDTEAEDVVRRALVLLSDHELNPSTFAVRICASTGASLPAAIMAGLATLSGPAHGGVAMHAFAALEAAQGSAANIDRFIAKHESITPYGYGYGHPLYPSGDPRAGHLLALLPLRGQARQSVQRMSDRLGIAANIDAALAACAMSWKAHPRLAFDIFCIGRLAGWVAHAMEQSLSQHIIRPRARFIPNYSDIS